MLGSRLFAASEPEDSRRDPLEEWQSRPKILRRKVGSVKKLRPISEDIFCIPTEDNPIEVADTFPFIRSIKQDEHDSSSP
jgi:hypothetical protein